MAMTLADAAKLSNDYMLKGIYETLIKTSPLMSMMPFETLNGTAYTVNREDEDNMPTVAFRQVDGVWTESTGKTTQKSYHLTILGGDCDVDNFLLASQQDVNQLMAEQVAMKTKIMAHVFDQKAIYGDEDNYEFDGFHVMVGDAGSDVQVHAGSDSTGGALNLMLLDEAIDKCTAGKPDFILMNKTIRRWLDAYLRSVGSYVTERDDYGNRFGIYNDIPVLTSDWLLQTEAISDGAYSAATGGVTSSIFVGYLGAGDGVTGLQNGGITYETWDRLEQKDASRTRIKWYVGMAQRSIKSLVRIDGVTAAAVTATGS